MKKAIICDIDGTLALLNGRNPYNPETVENDAINEPVAKILSAFLRCDKENVQLILVSGRYERYRKQTENWLNKHGIKNYLLFMRGDTDTRKDAVLKKEIYKEFIEGKFEVLFVLDDRDQTVAMWRNELGITCLQVNYGNF